MTRAGSHRLGPSFFRKLTIGFLSRILQRSERPRLEVLLDRASRSERHREAFYRGLLDESVWVPGRIDAGEVFIQPFDLDGRQTILVFTSERVLDEALRDHAGALHLPGRALLETLPQFDGLVLDYRTRLQKE
ncbi:MAG: SseB family protein, partial [bacterium]|nr:SseB family protein [Candidatus Kapabacteria bacterium]